jgi:hypothetical protein
MYVIQPLDKDQEIFKLYINSFFVRFYIKLTQYRSYGDFPSFLVEEDLRCPPYIISGKNRQLGRTTESDILSHFNSLKDSLLT